MRAWILGGVLAVLLLGVLALVARAHRRRRAVRQLEASLRAPRTVVDDAPDTSLAAQITRALADAGPTSRGRLRRGRGAALPRYLVLGDAAAGKRSVAAGSGLRFTPVAERGACWLAEEALLVTASASSPREHGAQEGWLAALDRLRRARARRPIDGVLLCVDVAVLTQADAAALEACAAALRTRMAALVARLGVRPPVYLILTKCDGLPGFRETFESLTPAERRRPWGFSLPSDDADPHHREAARRLGRLAQVLERRAILSMGEPRTLDECAAIYRLPGAVAALEAPLLRLLSETLAPEAPSGAAILRGVYLTGVVAPRGGDHDLLAPARAAPPASERLFLRELFSRVILPDVGLAPPSLARVARGRRLARASGCTIALLAVCFATFEARAYVANRRMLDDLRTALRRARSGAAAPVERAAALEPLRRCVTAFAAHARDGVPAALGVGLYRGHLLRPEVERLYASLVRTTWVVPHLRSIAEGLAASTATARPASADEHARLYGLLERYLRWTRDGSPPPPRTELSATWLLDGVEGAPGAPRQHLGTFLGLLTARPELAPPRDARVVATARAALETMPAASLAVDRIEAELAARGPALSLDVLLGTTATPLRASRAVPFAYSRRGWEEHVRGLLAAPPDALLGESWVLGDAGADGSDPARAARACALRGAYFARYAEQWRALLGTLQIVPPRDAADALAMLQALTRGEPPPLERLASEVARNAQLEPATQAGQAEEPGLLERLKQSLGSTAQAAAPAGARPACEEHGAAVVRAALRGFHRFGVAELRDGDAGGAPPVTAARSYHEQLAYVRDAMQAHQLDPRDAEPMLAKLSTAELTVRQLIDAQEVGWRPRFEALLWPPLLGARATASGDLARQRAASWCTAVVQPFEHGLSGRYPFAKNGLDASLADVAAFYRPEGGALWSAYEALLARDVPRSGDHFTVRAGSPLARRYRSQLPVFLARSQAIARSLFAASGAGPQVAFEVRVRPTADVASIVLEVDGQRVDFHNGPDRWVPLHWPGPSGPRGARLRVRGIGIDETIAQEGEWGIFRLIDSGSVGASPNERFFSVRFRLRTQRDVVLDVRPSRADHPLVGASGRPLEVFRASGAEAPRDIVSGVRACR